MAKLVELDDFIEFDVVHGSYIFCSPNGNGDFFFALMIGGGCIECFALFGDEAVQVDDVFFGNLQNVDKADFGRHVKVSKGNVEAAGGGDEVGACKLHLALDCQELWTAGF